MGNKRHWKPSSFNFAHILQTEGVNGGATCIGSLHLRRAIVVGEGFFKLGIVLKGPPLLLFVTFFTTRGGLKTWHSIPLLRWFFSSCWTWVFPFFSLYSPFFGCFGLFMIGKVSSQIKVGTKLLELKLELGLQKSESLKEFHSQF